MALAVRQWGEAAAQPVLLLHGFFSDGRSWRDPVAALQERGCERHWLAVDLPGHGSSRDQWPEPGVDAWPWLWAQLDAVAAGLDRPPLVIGYSMGARIAASWALARTVDRRPQLAGLVLESGHPGLGVDAARARQQADAMLAAQLEPMPPEAAADMWEAQPVLAGQGTRTEPDALAGLAAQRAIRVTQSPAALARALRLWGTGTMPDLRTCRPRGDLPALVVVGALDAKFSALAASWPGSLPNAQMVKVGGAGHHVSLERPTAWADAVAGWLE